MRVSTFMLAINAEETSDGLLNIAGGGLADFVPKSLPADAGLFVVLILDLEPSDIGSHRLEFSLVEAHGKSIANFGRDFQVALGTNTARVALPLKIGFDAPGMFSFHLSLDNVKQGLTRPLTVHAPKKL